MKILFVDTWIKGLTFINPVARYFSDDDKLFFVHCSSLYNNGITLDIVSDFPGIAIDASDYRHNYSAIIDEIKPDAVVFITAHGLFQRYYNFICARRGIPCFYFMHGARFTQTMPSRLKKGFRVIITRIVLYGKQSFYFLRDSLKINKTSFLACFFFLLEFFFLKNRFNTNPCSKFGMSYNKIFINHLADKEYFDIFFGSKQSYEIVGNVSVYENSMASKINGVHRDSIIFLSQPGCLEDIHDCGILSDIESICYKTKSKLILRIHPGDKTSELEYAALFGPCEQDRSIDMSMALSRAKLLVGFNSAALLAGQILGIPTLSYKTENFAPLPYLDGKLDFDEPALVSHFLCNNVILDNSFQEHPAKLIVGSIYNAI